MINLVQNLQQNEKELMEIVRTAEKRLSGAPPESLQISYTKGKTMYYMVDEKSNGKRSYLKKNKEQQIRALAQKQYDLKLVKIARQQLSAIQKLIHVYNPNIFDDLYNSIHPVRQQLISNPVLSDDEFAEKWLEMAYIPKSFSNDEMQIVTERGERVRSKSEKIIADKLALMNIPYKYEAPLVIGEYGTVYPDFTVLNKSSRKVFYWEHWGMMDDSNYAEKAVKKMDGYVRNDYYPGKNMIYTFESRICPLRTQTIEKIIREFLL